MATHPADRVKYKQDGEFGYLHRRRATAALGKPLPPGAVVHHADGSKDPDGPLVICQDEAYHKLLHARTRILRAGGNPNTDIICSSCHRVKPREAFYRNKNKTWHGRADRCIECWPRVQVEKMIQES